MELFTPWHLVILLVVVAFLYFGGTSVPELSKSLGKSLRIFRSEMRGDEDGKSDSADGRAADTAVATDPASPSLAVPRAIEAPAPVQALRSAAPVTASTSAARPRPRPRPNTDR